MRCLRCVGENESVWTLQTAASAATFCVFSQHVDTSGVEVDRVPSLGLRVGEDGTVWAFDPTRAERDPSAFEIDVAPPQAEQLCAPCAGERRGRWGELGRDGDESIANHAPSRSPVTALG